MTDDAKNLLRECLQYLYESAPAEVYDRITAHLAAPAPVPVACFLDRDNDGHWYVVKEAFRAEWDRWLQIPSDDEISWNVPDFAAPIGGAPNSVTLYTKPEAK